MILFSINNRASYTDDECDATSNLSKYSSLCETTHIFATDYTYEHRLIHLVAARY